jgi:3-methyladenine DNA glycosylase/8-oxoguanine DNA glycosylase
VSDERECLVDAERLEHLEAVADVLAHLVRLGLMQVRDRELREHLVALGLLDVEEP